MFSIDFQSRVPIYEQIVSQVERFIVTGILKENEQLPSVRQIAFDLGINPNTIQRAYTELERRGIIVSVVGKGSFITNKTNNIINQKINDIISNIKEDINTLNKLGLDNNKIKDKIFKD
jgi:GntR family transcriptional regulator